MQPTPAQPKIHIERMMYRSSISVQGESAASYALIKLIPAGGGSSLSVNLALVLDVSGSMYEEDGTGISRLKRVQEAAILALNKLRPTDTICDHRLRPQSSGRPSRDAGSRAGQDRRGHQPHRHVRRRSRRHINGPGDPAWDAGSREKRRQRKTLATGRPDRWRDVRRAGLPAAGRQAAQKKIRFNIIGVGTEWNQNLIKDLAKRAEGDWGYIDVNDVTAAERVFKEQFEALASAGFLDVEMHLRLKKDVKVKRVRQVVPDIKQLSAVEPEERHLVAKLGTLEHDKSSRYILDMSLPKRPDGKFSIADIEITFDTGSGKRETTGPVPLEITYSAASQGYINAEVAKHIDEVQIFELNENLQKAIATNNTAEVQRVAQNIEKKGEVMGPRAAKKTMLAKQVLQELNVGGRVSKKTQLAVDDAARAAEEAPAG